MANHREQLKSFLARLTGIANSGILNKDFIPLPVRSFELEEVNNSDSVKVYIKYKQLGEKDYTIITMSTRDVISDRFYHSLFNEFIAFMLFAVSTTYKDVEGRAVETHTIKDLIKNGL